MSLPRIGILGGMGPAATILLQQRILDATRVTTDDEHIPLLIDMNTQVPSRINYLIHHCGENPGPVLARMASKLQSSGVDAVVMPCCTAHHFADYIEEALTIPFLNMVRMVAHEVAGLVLPAAEIGLLASPATEKVGLFKTELKPYGLSARYPENSTAMLNAIKEIKSRGVSPQSFDLVKTACLELEASGAGAIIVGCSELSLMSRQLKDRVPIQIPIVDAVDVLTDSITGF